MLHVPYRGSAPAMTDLMAGVVNSAMDTVAVTQPFIQSGGLRLIASGYSQRVPAFPDTPTLAEQGFPGFGLAAWLGFVVPTGTPKDRVEALSAAIIKVVQSDEMAQKFAALGVIRVRPGRRDSARSSEANIRAGVKSSRRPARRSIDGVRVRTG